MRLTWGIPLPGPFRLSGTLWRSRPRRRTWRGTLPGWQCTHDDHFSKGEAVTCAQREARRRLGSGGV